MCEFQLHIDIVRLQFRAFLEERISLLQLALIKIDDAQLALRYGIIGSKPKDFAISFLRFG